MTQSVLRLGTRGSPLARAQAEKTAAALRAALGADAPAIETVMVRTTGDRIQDRSLAELGGKGLFTKELEEALIDHQIDIAVHSLKDVPPVLPAGLAIAGVLPRSDPRDAFISNLAADPGGLPGGARIGTGSVRRQAQLSRLRPDFRIVAMRGNIETRLAKLDAGEADAILLAYAGLQRLNLVARAACVLPAEEWLPAAGQGVIGLEIRTGDARAAALCARVDDPQTAIAASCERAFLAALGGDCRTPIAALAEIREGELFFAGEVLARDGTHSERIETRDALGEAPRGEAARIGHEAGLAIRARAGGLLESA